MSVFLLCSTFRYALPTLAFPFALLTLCFAPLPTLLHLQVNLRSETYAQGSRIPQMEFGTPEQDAMRRDFTINSLFYNINQVGSKCTIKACSTTSTR